ncbi:hypothetical protein Daus18300_013236 [Diaporthe australafricana]|uniref:Stc1 domain-containing protein n=1 Tax=Diaporthe australafricana TaxID=127596 RepID=A0ABR3VZT6_9PEZI
MAPRHPQPMTPAQVPTGQGIVVTTTPFTGLASPGSSPGRDLVSYPDDYHSDQDGEDQPASLQTANESNVHPRTQPNGINGAHVTKFKALKATLAGVWCPDCEKRKAEPGENNRSRKHAKHKCQDCREVKEAARAAHESQFGPAPAPSSLLSPAVSQANDNAGSMPQLMDQDSRTMSQDSRTMSQHSKTMSQHSRTMSQHSRPQAESETLGASGSRSGPRSTAWPESNKRWMVHTVAGPSEEDSDDRIDDDTASDDPVNPPKPIHKNDPHKDCFGQARDLRPVIAQIQDNTRQWHPESQLRPGALAIDLFNEQNRAAHFNDAGSSKTNPSPPASAWKDPGPLKAAPGQTSIAPDVTRKDLFLIDDTGDRPQPYQSTSHALQASQAMAYEALSAPDDAVNTARAALDYHDQVREFEKFQESFNEDLSDAQQSVRTLDAPWGVRSSMDYSLVSEPGSAQQPWSENPAFKEYHGPILKPADEEELSAEDKQMIDEYINWPPGSDPEPEPASPAATGPPPATNT